MEARLTVLAMFAGVLAHNLLDRQMLLRRNSAATRAPASGVAEALGADRDECRARSEQVRGVAPR